MAALRMRSAAVPADRPDCHRPRGILDRAADDAGLGGLQERDRHVLRIVAKAVLQIRADGQGSGLAHAGQMAHQADLADAQIALCMGKREAGAGGGERLESQVLQQSRRSLVPGIRNDKARAFVMQLPERIGLFDLSAHVFTFHIMLVARRSSCALSRPGDRATRRVMDLMCSTRRKRSADQSSSIATMRTGSKPAAPSTGQPESRLNSHCTFWTSPWDRPSTARHRPCRQRPVSCLRRRARPA